MERPDDDGLDGLELFELPQEPESDLPLLELFELLPQEPESDLPLLLLPELFELPHEPESDLPLLLDPLELPHEPVSEGRDGAGLFEVLGAGRDGPLRLPPPGSTMIGGMPTGPLL
ncbi:MAG: hypothetical protein U0768_10520 [Anaerolineae bacterium]